MLTTEDEAKTKSCPETYTVQLGTAASVMASCRGSTCMAWRWKSWACYGPDGTFRNLFDGDPPPDGSLTGGDPPRPFTYRRLGYCGKVGRP